MRKVSRLTVVLAAVVLCAIVAVAVALIWTPKPRPGTAEPKIIEVDEDLPASTAHTQNLVTLAKVKRIRKGMTYRQVKQIIGVDGAVANVTGFHVPGRRMKVFNSQVVWKNSVGGYFAGTFQNNHLISKSQFGLK